MTVARNFHAGASITLTDTDQRRDALGFMLRVRFGHVRITNTEPTDPLLAAGADSLYATPPAAIAAKYLVTSLRMRLASDGGQAV